MTSIKVKYKNDIRRVTLPEPLSFAKLREIIGVLYRSTQLPSNFVVKYVDDENDYISITSDIELEEACACAKRSNSNILRMFISEPNSEGKPEELPLRRDFDVHPQQTTVVTQSQLVSIEQILNSKETLSQQQIQQQQEQQKQAQLEEQKRQAEEQRRFLQQQQQLEQQRLERLRQLEQQQLEQQQRLEQQRLEQQRLEQQRLQQQVEQERQRELEQQRLQEEQQKREQLEQQRLQEEQLKREQELALQRQAVEKGQYMAVFVEDVGIQDGAIFAPGVEFEKVWRLKNTGTAPWPAGTQLAFKVGDKLSGATEVFPVAQLAQPGETVNVSAALRSPTQPGRYIAYFRLIAPDGSHFGHRIWADIVVEESRMDIDPPQQTPPPPPSPQLQPQPQPQPQSPLQTNTLRSPLNAELENAIDQMVSLGFADRSVNAEALRKASGSLEEAINLLLDGQRFY